MFEISPLSPNQIQTLTGMDCVRILGPEATDEDARTYAEWMTTHGYEVFLDEGHQLDALKDGELISETEWQQTLSLCFNG